MLSFIAEQWLAILFGAIAAGLGYLAKHFYNLYKHGKNCIQEEEKEQLLKKSEEMMDVKIKNIAEIMNSKNKTLVMEDGKIFERLDKQEKSLEILTKGILSIHGHQFKADCKRLIEQNESITLEQFTQLQLEHEIYNSLGGNHEGDILFGIVEEKYTNQIVK